MRLFPNSLAGRTVLLVVAVIAVAEFATLSLIGHFRRTSHLNQTVQLIASQVRLLQIVLPSLDAARRRQLSGADAGERGLQLGPDDSHVPRH